MKPSRLPLIVGLPGPGLDPQELKVLRDLSPAGIILFSRNIVDASQVRDLVSEVKEMSPAPYLSIDLEGGMVNRLGALWGELPSAFDAAAGGRDAVQALGEAAGAACRFLGIEQDFAPVVDLACPSGLIGTQRRSFGGDPERAAELAGAFGEGLRKWGVLGCLKHFPGLGAVEVDTHEELPCLELNPDQLRSHIDVFRRLSRVISSVMVAHVLVPAIGCNDVPASLSGEVIRKARGLPGHPVVLSDDLEMGALKNLGRLPELVTAALEAGHDGVLVCNSFEKLPEIADEIRKNADTNPDFATQLEKSLFRLDRMVHDRRGRNSSAGIPDEALVSRLWERARALGFATSRDQVEGSFLR